MKIRNKSNRDPITPHSGALIALTGRIGTGKSFVLKEINKLGYPIFDSDLEARNIVKHSPEIKKFLTADFPETIKDGVIDFKSLGDLAFKAPHLLQKLNHHTHSEIRLKQAEFINNNPGKTIVFEIPLLFENSRENYFDYIILTYSDEQTIAKRALQRKNMTEDKLRGILATQMDIDPNDRRVDFRIDTSVSDDHTKIQLLKIFNGN